MEFYHCTFSTHVWTTLVLYILVCLLVSCTCMPVLHRISSFRVCCNREIPIIIWNHDISATKIFRAFSFLRLQHSEPYNNTGITFDSNTYNSILSARLWYVLVCDRLLNTPKSAHFFYRCLPHIFRFPLFVLSADKAKHKHRDCVQILSQNFVNIFILFQAPQPSISSHGIL